MKVKSKAIFIIFTILAFHLSFFVPFDGVIYASQEVRLETKPEFKEDSVIVKYKGIEKLEIVNILSNSELKENTGIESAINFFEQREDVEFVQPNYIYSFSNWKVDKNRSVPDGYSSGHYWYYESANIPEMWNLLNCPEGQDCGGSKEVIIAVIDSGVAFEDFDDSAGMTGARFTKLDTFDNINLYVNEKEIPNNLLDDDCNGYVDDINGVDTFAATELQQLTCFGNTPIPVSPEKVKSGHPVDTYGHGTFVSSLIVSNLENNISPGFNLSLMPIASSVHFEEFFTTASLVEGINYAVNHGADVINLSLAGGSNDFALQNAISNAIESGVFVVASSGNEGGNLIGSPGNIEGVFTVGAASQNDRVTNYTDIGEELDILAYVGSGLRPNQDSIIHETLACFGSCSPQDLNSGDYQFDFFESVGTSFAAPQISSLVGIMKSINPSLSNERIKEIIMSTSKPTITETVNVGIADFEAAAFETLNAGKLSIVFRFLNNQIGSAHFYTIKEREKELVLENSAAGGIWEGAFTQENNAFLAFEYNKEKEVCTAGAPVYRFLNTYTGSTHFYTIDLEQRETVISNSALNGIWEGQFVEEGVAFCALKDSFENAKPVYRFRNEALGGAVHFYTIDEDDLFTMNVNTAPGGIWEGIFVNEGIAFYAIELKA